MGNEHSKNKELTKNESVSEKHENGSVNGLSANITSNGLEIDVKSETTVHQNGEPPSLNQVTESTDLEVVKSDSQPADTPVAPDVPASAEGILDTLASTQAISELAATVQAIPETVVTAVLKEEQEVVKKGKEKVRLFGKMFKKKEEPAADVKTVEEKEKEEKEKEKEEEKEKDKEEGKEKEISSEDQMDASLPPTDPPQDSNGEEAAAAVTMEHHKEYPHQKAETSTQTDRKRETDISTQTGRDEDPGEDVVMTETDTTEEDSFEFAVINSEEVFADSQPAGIIIEDVVIMEDVYENIVFSAEQAEVTPEDSKPEMAAEPEINPNKSTKEDNMVAEENKPEETVPFAAASETTDCAVVITPEPGVDEVITEDNSEGAGDMSADAALIETTEPEPNAVTLEAGEANGIPSPEAEPLTTVTETITEVVHEELNAPPANQDMPVKDPDVPLETEIQVKEKSTHERVKYACEQEKLSPVAASEPFSNCDGCPVVEIIVEACSDVFNIEELLEDTSYSPDDEAKTQPDENAEVAEDVTAEVRPETEEESEHSFSIVEDNDEEIPEAAICFLSQQFAPRASSPWESQSDNCSNIEEDVIVPTVAVTLYEEQAASLHLPEEPVETLAVETNGEATEAEDVIVPTAVVTLCEEQEASLQLPEESVETLPEETSGEVTEAEDVIGPTAVVTLYEEQEANLHLPEEPVETLAEETNGEATEAEDVIVPTAVVTLCEEQEASLQLPEESVETLPEETSGEVTEAEEDATTKVLEKESNAEAFLEKLEVTENIIEEPEGAQAYVSPTDATEESEPRVSVQEEVSVENISPTEALLEDADKDTDAPYVTDVEVLETVNPTDSNCVLSKEPTDESERPLKTKTLEIILETTEDEDTEEIIDERDDSADVSAAIEGNPDDSQTATSDEWVEDVLEAIVEEIIREEVECSLVTSEEGAPEISVVEKAEDESRVNSSTPHSQKAETPEGSSATSSNMDTLLVMLQSACTSVVEDSAYVLGGLEISSLSHSITVTIHVAPEEEQ